MLYFYQIVILNFTQAIKNEAKKKLFIKIKQHYPNDNLFNYIIKTYVILLTYVSFIIIHINKRV